MRNSRCDWRNSDRCDRWSSPSEGVKESSRSVRIAEAHAAGCCALAARANANRKRHTVPQCIAITAMAHRLARLVYRMLKHGQDYIDKGMQYYEDRHRFQQLQLLKKRAAKLGLQVIEIPAAGA